MYKLYKCNINDVGHDLYSQWFSQMEEEKQRRVDRFKFYDDRKRTVAGDHLARIAVSEFCRINVDDIRFAVAPKGKPYAVGLDVHFSVSHSNDMVVCGVCSEPIGVDIEKLRPVKAELAKRVCKDNELYNMLNIKGEVDILQFFKLWTIKEAYFKMIGTGITDFKSLDTELIRNNVYTDVTDEYVFSITTEDFR